MRAVSRYIVISCLMILIASIASVAIPDQGIAQEHETPNSTFFLPEAKAHPLPRSLATWSDEHDSGDYFNAIAPARFGHLVWTDFPIRVYLDTHSTDQVHESPSEPITRPGQPLATHHHQDNWIAAVESAIDDWNQIIPIEQIFVSDQADITIIPKRPPLQWESDSENTYTELSPPLPRRARTAETTYSLYIHHQPPRPAVIKQRYQILLAPNQTSRYLQATARHELGHALGIWGHSPVADDALYFAQVAQPQGISPRDINTLQRIYQQPTQLGWPLIESSGVEP